MESGVFPVSDEHTGDPVCACVQLWSPSSLSHGFLSFASLFYPACTAENKVNKYGRVAGQPSFTPKTKQCPHQTRLHIRTKAWSMGRRRGALWHTRSNVSFSKPERHRRNKQISSKIRNTTLKTNSDSALEICPIYERWMQFKCYIEPMTLINHENKIWSYFPNCLF